MKKEEVVLCDGKYIFYKDDEESLVERLQNYLSLDPKVGSIGVAKGDTKPEKLFVYLHTKQHNVLKIESFEGHPVEFVYIGKISLSKE